MESISNQIGKRIKDYRNRAGLTQEALALNSGLNASFLGDVERGIKKPSIESLEKLLMALNVSFIEFFDFEANIKPFKDLTALEKLNMELQNRSKQEIELVYNIIKQILIYNDGKNV